MDSNGSGTTEDLFWKLDALQTFIRDLHWPEDEFAKHLDNRMKLMSSNMIESCVKRWDYPRPALVHKAAFYTLHTLRLVALQSTTPAVSLMKQLL